VARLIGFISAPAAAVDMMKVQTSVFKQSASKDRYGLTELTKPVNHVEM